MPILLGEIIFGQDFFLQDILKSGNKNITTEVWAVANYI